MVPLEDAQLREELAAHAALTQRLLVELDEELPQSLDVSLDLYERSLQSVHQSVRGASAQIKRWISRSLSPKPRVRRSPLRKSPPPRPLAPIPEGPRKDPHERRIALRQVLLALLAKADALTEAGDGQRAVNALADVDRVKTEIRKLEEDERERELDSCSRLRWHASPPRSKKVPDAATASTAVPSAGTRPSPASPAPRTFESVARNLCGSGAFASPPRDPRPGDQSWASPIVGPDQAALWEELGSAQWEGDSPPNSDEGSPAKPKRGARGTGDSPASDEGSPAKPKKGSPAKPKKGSPAKLQKSARGLGDSPTGLSSPAKPQKSARSPEPWFTSPRTPERYAPEAQKRSLSSDELRALLLDPPSPWQTSRGSARSRSSGAAPSPLLRSPAPFFSPAPRSADRAEKDRSPSPWPEWRPSPDRERPPPNHAGLRTSWRLRAK